MIETSSEVYSERSKRIAYFFWLLWLIGIAGAQRFYVGRNVSGLIYLCTWGIFGLGQLIDLALIPEMVESYNFKHKLLHANIESSQELVVSNKDSLEWKMSKIELSREVAQNNLMQEMFGLAKQNNDVLTVDRVVLSTGRSFAEVEEILEYMCESGYATVYKHPVTGLTTYQSIDSVC
jgi:hypothetical protein